MTVNVTNNPVKDMPLWAEIKKLSERDKINLITLISASLSGSLEDGETLEGKTNRMVKRFAGSWKGDNSTEEIIDIINKGKRSHSEPLKF